MPPSHPQSPKRHHKNHRNVSFNDTHESNAPRSTASSRVPSDLELRTRRGSRHGQLEGTDTEDSMDERRPPFHRHNDGKSEEALLYPQSKETHRATRRGSPNTSPHRRASFGADSLDLDDRFGSGNGAYDRRPVYRRTSTMRSQSPGRAEKAMLETRRTYQWAAFFLVLSLVSFVIQTETAVYIQHELGWSKAYAMLYLTHSSWILLYPFLLLILRLNNLHTPWSTFWAHHLSLLKSISHSVEHQQIIPHSSTYNPLPYLLRTIALVTCSLTIAGGSWYVAVNLTSPSDLTAIYNCSAFFAYAFSVPLLNEKLRWDKSLAVLLAIGGVLMIAYGDSPSAPVPGAPSDTTAVGAPALGFDPEKTTTTNKGTEAENRLLGNLIIGIGSVLYGLYEVLYKRLACPPSHTGHTTTAKNGMIFATLIGSLIGAFTLCVLWIPLPLLHWSGLEVFELPSGKAAGLLFVSVGANVVFSGSFLVLISLTSPVLSSVAALLTIFLVAFTDWLWTGKPIGSAALVGGAIIVVAFGVLSWSTWVEMREEAKDKEVIDSDDEEEERQGLMGA